MTATTNTTTETIVCVDCGKEWTWEVPEWDLTPLHCEPCLGFGY